MPQKPLHTDGNTRTGGSFFEKMTGDLFVIHHSFVPL
jgi:hypothetical protein